MCRWFFGEENLRETPVIRTHGDERIQHLADVDNERRSKKRVLDCLEEHEQERLCVIFRLLISFPKIEIDRKRLHRHRFRVVKLSALLLGEAGRRTGKAWDDGVGRVQWQSKAEQSKPSNCGSSEYIPGCVCLFCWLKLYACSVRFRM